MVKNIVLNEVVDAAVLNPDGEPAADRRPEGVADDAVVARAELDAVAVVPSGDPGGVVVVEQVVADERGAHRGEVDGSATGHAVVVDDVLLEQRVDDDAVALWVVGISAHLCRV